MNLLRIESDITQTATACSSGGFGGGFGGKKIFGRKNPFFRKISQTLPFTTPEATPFQRVRRVAQFQTCSASMPCGFDAPTKVIATVAFVSHVRVAYIDVVGTEVFHFKTRENRVTQLVSRLRCPEFSSN